MRFLPLVTAYLGRHKRRTLLTMASVALALFLFASLRTVVTTLRAAADFGSARRLVSTNASGLIFPMPVAYASRLATVPGVEKVTWSNWFGGQYGDGKRFFANFAVDAKSYLDLYPEMSVPADQKEAFLQDRSGALDRRAAGGPVRLEGGAERDAPGHHLPGRLDLHRPRRLHPDRPGDQRRRDDVPLGLPRRAHRAERAGGVVHHADRPPRERAAESRKTIDDLFRNSSAPTKTGTEQAFNASFATMWGNVSLLMNTIGMAVVFAILLVAANAMMMSARERTRELAVLKTIGFSDRRLFGLVMLEAGLITVTGAVLGLGAAKLLYQRHQLQRGRLPPRLRRDRDDARGGRGHRAAADARERDRAGGAGGAAAGGGGAAERRDEDPALTYNLPQRRASARCPPRSPRSASGSWWRCSSACSRWPTASPRRSRAPAPSATCWCSGRAPTPRCRAGSTARRSASSPRRRTSARGADGRALASAESYVVIPLGRMGDTTQLANVVVRGVSEQAWQVRNNVTLLEGTPPRGGQERDLRRQAAGRAGSPTPASGRRCTSPAGPGP